MYKTRQQDNKAGPVSTLKRSNLKRPEDSSFQWWTPNLSSYPDTLRIPGFYRLIWTWDHLWAVCITVAFPSFRDTDSLIYCSIVNLFTRLKKFYFQVVLPPNQCDMICLHILVQAWMSNITLSMHVCKSSTQIHYDGSLGDTAILDINTKWERTKLPARNPKYWTKAFPSRCIPLSWSYIAQRGKIELESRKLPMKNVLMWHLLDFLPLISDGRNNIGFCCLDSERGQEQGLTWIIMDTSKSRNVLKWAKFSMIQIGCTLIERGISKCWNAAFGTVCV